MIPGFRGQNHPHQVKRRGALDDVDDRQTHPTLVAQLADLCGGPFTLDAAAAHHNAQCPIYNTLTGAYARSYDGGSIAIHALDENGRRLSTVARCAVAEGLRPFRDLSERAPDRVSDAQTHIYVDDRGDSGEYVRVPQVRHAELCESAAFVPGHVFGQHAGLSGQGAAAGTVHNGASGGQAENLRAQSEDNRELKKGTGRATPPEVAWAGRRVWLNCPYSSIPHWALRGWEESKTIVTCMLLPANRTEQPWWQDLVEPFRDGRDTLVEGRSLSVHFIRKRWAFLSKGQTIGNSTSKNPPFGLVALVWR